MAAPIAQEQAQQEPEAVVIQEPTPEPVAEPVVEPVAEPVEEVKKEEPTPVAAPVQEERPDFIVSKGMDRAAFKDAVQALYNTTDKDNNGVLTIEEWKLFLDTFYANS
jgi:hypothetical protein